MTMCGVNYFPRRIISADSIITTKKKMALAPLLMMGIPAAINAIGGILGIANESRKLSGGRVRLRHKYRGLPRVNRKGHGLSPMYIARPYVGAGLRQKKKSAVKKRKGKGLLFPAGRGLSSMYIARPYVGAGLRKTPVRKYHKKGGALRYVRRRVSRGKGMLTPGNPGAALLKQLVMPSTSAFIGKPYIKGPVEGPLPHPTKTMINIPPTLEFPGSPFVKPIRPKYPGKPQSPYYPDPNAISYAPLIPYTGGKITKRILRKRLYGRGVVADTLGKIPILGAILSPIARALGGKIKKQKKTYRKKGKRGGLLYPVGRGMSPMYISRPYVGAGLGKKKVVRRKGGRHGNMHSMSTTIRKILSGGALVPRKGYYRTGPSGKRVHVRPTVVRKSYGGKGGYLPYTWGPNIIRC